MSDKITEVEKNPAGHAVIILLLLALSVGFFGVWLTGKNNDSPEYADRHAINGQANNGQAKANNIRDYYMEILAEPRPGFRLARLKAFIGAHADSDEAQYAKIQIHSLTESEKTAWAKLSDSRYNVNIHLSAKQNALQEYIESWSSLHRKKEIKSYQDKLTQLAKIRSGESKPQEAEIKIQIPPSRFESTNSNIQSDRLAGASIYEPEPSPRITIYSNPAPPATRPKTPAPKIEDVRIKRARPAHYPKRAKRKNISAVVVLSLDIDEKGRVARANLVSVRADKYDKKFVKAAKRAALSSRFYPKTIDGKPVARTGYKRKYKFVPK